MSTQLSHVIISPNVPDVNSLVRAADNHVAVATLLRFLPTARDVIEFDRGIWTHGGRSVRVELKAEYLRS